MNGAKGIAQELVLLLQRLQNDGDQLNISIPNNRMYLIRGGARSAIHALCVCDLVLQLPCVLMHFLQQVGPAVAQASPFTHHLSRTEVHYAWCTTGSAQPSHVCNGDEMQGCMLSMSIGIAAMQYGTAAKVTSKQHACSTHGLPMPYQPFIYVSRMNDQCKCAMYNIDRNPARVHLPGYVQSMRMRKSLSSELKCTLLEQHLLPLAVLADQLEEHCIS